MLTFTYIVQSVKIPPSHECVSSRQLTINTVSLVAILIGTSLHNTRAEDLLFLLSSHT
jgi:hypothetical protein